MIGFTQQIDGHYGADQRFVPQVYPGQCTI